MLNGIWSDSMGAKGGRREGDAAYWLFPVFPATAIRL